MKKIRISKENINILASLEKQILSILSCLCNKLDFSFSMVVEFIEKTDISIFTSYAPKGEGELYKVRKEFFFDFIYEELEQGKILIVDSSSSNVTDELTDYMKQNKLELLVLLPLISASGLWGCSVFFDHKVRNIAEEEIESLKSFEEVISTILHCDNYVESLKSEARKLEHKVTILKKLKALEDPFQTGNLALTMIEMALRETGTGIAVIDEEYNVRYLNKAWEEKYGNYRGKKCHEYFMGLSCACEDCKAGEILSSGAVDISEEFLFRQGRTFDVIRTPFEGTGGEKFVAEVYIDITERKLVEERAFTLNSIVEQSPSTILITDTSGHIEYVNPKFTEVTGYTPEEVMGKNPRILKSGETTPGEYKVLWKTIASGEEWRGEFHNKKKNGDLYWEAASISPLRNSKGKITHYLSIKEDITERKQMEEELRLAKEKAESASRIKSEFLANISHELRTPMNSILGISKVLATKKSDNLDEKQIKGLNMINQSGRRLLGLIDDILTLAKLEAKKSDLDLENFVLKELLYEIEVFSRSILKKNIEFIIKKDENLPLTLRSDRKKIIQVLANLISNAIKFTHKGIIELKIYKKDSMIVFSVKDTGIGIKKEDLSIIFQRFKQVDGGHSREYKGTGLGLSISRELAGLMKGYITVESEPEKGSIFSLYIPYNK